MAEAEWQPQRTARAGAQLALPIETTGTRPRTTLVRLDQATRERNLEWVRRLRADLARHADAA